VPGTVLSLPLLVPFVPSSRPLVRFWALCWNQKISQPQVATGEGLTAGSSPWPKISLDYIRQFSTLSDVSWTHSRQPPGSMLFENLPVDQRLLAVSRQLLASGRDAPPKYETKFHPCPPVPRLLNPGLGLFSTIWNPILSLTSRRSHEFSPAARRGERTNRKHNVASNRVAAPFDNSQSKKETTTYEDQSRRARQQYRENLECQQQLS
jgi:hypothetical protein